MLSLACLVCGTGFTAKRPTARYCGERCRKRAQRHPEQVTPAGPPEAAGPAPDGHLVAAVRRELEEAGQVDGFLGQLALQLAEQITAPGATGVTALSRELRAVVRAATSRGPVPEDEVARARRSRERKARRAARRGEPS